MTTSDFEKLVGPELASALSKRGYTQLTPVQEAVLADDLADRDLRITSQTGSGKTVAIGLSLRNLVRGDARAKDGVGRPLVLVVAPTRELAKQVEEELKWLYAPLRIFVTSVTGGANAREERRALGQGPAVLVGTPGRLLDHLTRGAVDASQVGAIVLDEADRMLDLGFREELEAILGHAPQDHLTHLVSATFPREVRALADRVQNTPAHVEGTPLGTANTDIDHVIHLVDQRERGAAIVNLLLSDPTAQTLIFTRTRADVASLSKMLEDSGFRVGSLSGEMEQNARNRALAAFKSGKMHTLVATDVAARGIDVQDITRVIHADPPTDADTYTHRSGRTGRAGRKGVSAILVVPPALNRTLQVLKRANVRARMEAVPTAADIRKNRDSRMFAELTAPDPEGFPGYDDDTWSLAKRVTESENATQAMARLILRLRATSPSEPREVRPVSASRDSRMPREFDNGPMSAGPRSPRTPDRPEDWVGFRVTFGQEHGADARRLLAMICRRGGIEGRDVGAIFINRTFSTVNVARAVADRFAKAASEPDDRNPRVTIRKDHGVEQRPAPRMDAPREERMRAIPVAPREVPAARASRPRLVPAAPRDAEDEVEIPKPRASRPRIVHEDAVEIPKPRASRPRLVPAAPRDEDEVEIPKPRASRPRPAEIDVPKPRPSRPREAVAEDHEAPRAERRRIVPQGPPPSGGKGGKGRPAPRPAAEGYRRGIRSEDMPRPSGPRPTRPGGPPPFDGPKHGGPKHGPGPRAGGPGPRSGGPPPRGGNTRPKRPR
jgi:ATP-dependent RNA helicase DeaD